MNIIDIYKALSDESRLRLFYILSHGYFNVQELTSILDISQSTVSHHLKVLMQAGLAKSMREGTWIYYTTSNGESESENLSPCSIAKPFLEAAADNQFEIGINDQIKKDQKAIAKILAKRRDHAHNFFEANAGKWNQLRSGMLGDDSYMSEVVKLIPENSDLLELGCGSGALFEKILPRKAKTIGVDYSQAMLDEARQKLSKFNGAVDLRLGNLEHLPLGDESVDTAVAYMVMHHIAQPLEAIKEIHRVLKDDGELVIADLNSHEHEYMRERYADLWLGFETKEFKSWLTKAGFKNVKSQILGSKNEVFILTCSKQ